MEYPSKHIEHAVTEIARLPGIGKKTALRLALYLLSQETSQTQSLSDALTDMRKNVRYCPDCRNISDDGRCRICSNPKRDHSMICVVEDTRDVMAIENTSQYFGLYHVLGGILSPIDGISPDDLTVDLLFRRCRDEEINELILALPATMEGDTTAFYISKKLNNSSITISNIARGVPVGSELEYTDEITLGRSIANRTKF